MNRREALAREARPEAGVLSEGSDAALCAQGGGWRPVPSEATPLRASSQVGVGVAAGAGCSQAVSGTPANMTDAE